MTATMVGNSCSPVAVSDAPITPSMSMVGTAGAETAPRKPLHSAMTMQPASMPNSTRPMPWER